MQIGAAQDRGAAREPRARRPRAALGRATEGLSDRLGALAGGRVVRGRRATGRLPEVLRARGVGVPARHERRLGSKLPPPFPHDINAWLVYMIFYATLSRKELVTATNPGHVLNAWRSGYAPQVARKAAFSGSLYQAAM